MLLAWIEKKNVCIRTTGAYIWVMNFNGVRIGIPGENIWARNGVHGGNISERNGVPGKNIPARNGVHGAHVPLFSKWYQSDKNLP